MPCYTIELRCTNFLIISYNSNFLPTLVQATQKSTSGHQMTMAFTKKTTSTNLRLFSSVLCTFKKQMKREEEVTPVVLPHVLQSTLGSHRHIVQISC